MDRKAALHFDALPTEILRTIASFTPAEDVVRLSTTSTALRRIFWDALVFRSCLERTPAVLQEGAEAGTGDLDVASLAPVLGNSVHAWARLAVANSYGRQWKDWFLKDYSSPDNAVVARLKRKLNDFVPQLLILGHYSTRQYAETAVDEFITSGTFKGDGTPCLQKTRHKTRIAGSRALSQFFDQPSLAFWLCTGVLSESTNDRRDITRQMNWHFVNRCEQVVAHRADLQTILGGLAAWGWLLKDYLDQCPLDENRAQPSQRHHARFTPRLKDFPCFGRTQDPEKIPLPFMSRSDWNLKVDSKYRMISWDEWIHYQIGQMADPEFLARSPWCGYWSFERNQQNRVPAIEFANAVEGLSIHPMQYVDEPVKNSRRLLGTYEEYTIDFQLEGYMTPQGQFKLGPPGELWAWMGWMTPFGLFGYWGSSDGLQSAGACWLWQESWTDEANKERARSTNYDASSSDTNGNGQDSSDEDF